MTNHRKLQLIMDLLRRTQAEAAEAYNTDTAYIASGGHSVPCVEALFILDPLLEEAERIYAMPEYHYRRFTESVTGENAMSPRPPQGF